MTMLAFNMSTKIGKLKMGADEFYGVCKQERKKN